MKYIALLRTNATETEIQSLNTKIQAVIKRADGVEIEHIGLNDLEMDKIMEFLKSKRVNDKTEYSKLTLTNDKLAFIEKKLRLV